MAMQFLYGTFISEAKCMKLCRTGFQFRYAREGGEGERVRRRGSETEGGGGLEGCMLSPRFYMN